MAFRLNPSVLSTALIADARDQRGFSLVEAVVATAIAVIAVIGIAHSFGMGRALITRYEVGRVALGLAQQRMESYAMRPTEEIAITPGDSVAFVYDGQSVGFESWSVAWVDDPYDGTGAGDTSNGPNDMKLVTVTVRWGTGNDANNVSLHRLFPSQ